MTRLPRLLSVCIILHCLNYNTQYTAIAHSGCACDPDVTGEGIVDDIDLAEIQACLGREPINSCIRADVDCDGDIDGDDMEAWGCMSDGGEASWCCPFVVNLELFPFEPASSGTMTGVAVLQSTLNYLWADDTQWFYDNQISLYNNVNTDGLPGLSAAEMWNALKNKTPQPSLIPLPYSSYGYNFNLQSRVATPGDTTDTDFMLGQIAQWIAYENGTYGGHMQGHPYHVPAIIPAYGDYSHWMAARGFRANEPAYPLPANLIVWGLFLNDPHPDGLGEFFYVEADEFIRTYYLPLVTTDGYNGKYIAICEPPAASPLPVTVGKSPSRLDMQLTLAVKDSLAGASGGAAIPSVTEAEDLIIQAARAAAIQEVAPGDELFSSVFPNLTAEAPLYVKSPKGDHYQVGFGPENSNIVQVVVSVDLTGALLSAMWSQESFRFLPSVNEAKALVIGELVRQGYLASTVIFNTMEVISADPNPYKIKWSISGTVGRVKKTFSATVSPNSVVVKVPTGIATKWAECVN